MSSPSAAAVDHARIDLDGLEHPRPSGSSSSTSWVRCASATVRPRLHLAGRERQLARRAARSTERLAGAVDADDADPVARAEPPGDVVEQRAGRRRTQVDVLEVEHVLAEPLGREPLQLDAGRAAAARPRSARWPRRCGTSASRCAPAGRGAARRAPCGPGSAGAPRRPPPAGRARPWPARTPRSRPRRRRTAPSCDLPGRVADRVEEPAVVGDDDAAPDGARGPGGRPARRPPRRRGGWSARRARSRSWSPSSSAASAHAPALAAGQRPTRRGRARPRGRPPSSRRRLADARRRRPTRGRAGRRAPPRARVAVGSSSSPWCEVADRQPAAPARPGRCRAPRARSSTSQQRGLAVAVAADDADPLARADAERARRRAAGGCRSALETRSRLTRFGHSVDPRGTTWAPATGPLAPRDDVAHDAGWPASATARSSAASSAVDEEDAWSARSRRRCRRSAPSPRPAEQLAELGPQESAAACRSLCSGGAERARRRRGAARRAGRRRRRPARAPARRPRSRSQLGVDRGRGQAVLGEGDDPLRRCRGPSTGVEQLAAAGAERGAAEQRERHVAAELARPAPSSSSRRGPSSHSAVAARPARPRRRRRRRPCRRPPGSPCAMRDVHRPLDAVRARPAARGRAVAMLSPSGGTASRPSSRRR